ncbi:unnamed protein product [Caretta caretta]
MGIPLKPTEDIWGKGPSGKDQKESEEELQRTDICSSSTTAKDVAMRKLYNQCGNSLTPCQKSIHQMTALGVCDLEGGKMADQNAEKRHRREFQSCSRLLTPTYTDICKRALDLISHSKGRDKTSNDSFYSNEGISMSQFTNVTEEENSL